MSNIAASLPRGLGPARLLIVFFVIVSLFLFRSYYLPNLEPVSEYDVAATSDVVSPGPTPQIGPEDADISEVEEGYYEYQEDPELAQMIEESEKANAAYYEQEDGDADMDANASTTSDDSVLHSHPRPHSHPHGHPEPKPSEVSLPNPEPQTGPKHASGPDMPLELASDTAPIHAFESQVPPCRRLPGADKVVVMVKTGATEVFSRIPEQLVTLAECVPNFMVFSDMEQHIGEFHIQDALDEIGQEYKEGHEDFQFYNAIRAAHKSYGDVSVLGSDKAWALDKWKNIPMLHKAYLKYPDAEWFVTIDADTYLSWMNLLLLLDRLDPEDPLYAGCVYWHGPTAFAQGGTGYVLSRKAVEKFEKVRTPEKIAAWEKETSTICCGDVMLSVAMGHAGVFVQGAWPMFQVDPPSGYVFGDGTWCTPAITWHHTHSYEVEALWQFEQEWLNKTWDEEDPGAVPYLFRDVFEEFVIPHVSEKKKDWNNGSGNKIFTEPKDGHVKEDADWDWKNDEEKQQLWDDLSELEKSSIESADRCRGVCETDPECVQWSWHPGTCKLSHQIKMGRPVDGKEEYTSGWMIERVQAFKEARGECGDISWNID
jgi:hypothetical protein